MQASKDVLAVGYGPQHFAPQLPGCVALWSLRNPARPLWAFATASGERALAQRSFCCVYLTPALGSILQALPDECRACLWM